MNKAFLKKMNQKYPEYKELNEAIAKLSFEQQKVVAMQALIIKTARALKEEKINIEQAGDVYRLMLEYMLMIGTMALLKSLEQGELNVSDLPSLHETIIRRVEQHSLKIINLVQGFLK